MKSTETQMSKSHENIKVGDLAEYSAANGRYVVLVLEIHNEESMRGVTIWHDENRLWPIGREFNSLILKKFKKYTGKLTLEN